ncbi:hypothetical protein GALMADRAFT_242427 [Galerina marginata CBS 339.88]|uniref:CENP-V/GFA domain-containing protein n=1 Tax=Galerina marginata (strain CBS 339.88) TaxID=685588 RepID=A0A067TAC6_GALM3|nr:hypothetical protein GALMADRAFT_242427 [Galerina marginata CBS 339.88]
MAFYALPIEGPPLVGSFSLRPVDLKTTDLNGYNVSPTRVQYFCLNCSAKMFFRDNNTEWSVAGGILESLEGIGKLVNHVNIAETMDGGLADQMRILDGRTMLRYAKEAGGEELPVGWRSKELKAGEKPTKDDKLHARCQCGAIRVYVTRPDKLSAETYAPYPDILYATKYMRLSSLRNPRDEKWWLRPSFRTNRAGDLVHMHGSDYERASPSAETKYLAGQCVCEHCRLGSGFEVQSYAFLSRTNVYEEGSEHPIDLVHESDRPRGLKQYSSSPGKYREFCGTCGATAFWWHIGRPDVIDLSIGLLDQEEDGVRAEDWFSWHKGRLAFMELALTTPRKGIIQGLVDGLKDICVDRPGRSKIAKN